MKSNQTKQNRGRVLKIAAVAAAILLGVGLMAYPYLANYLYEHRQNSTISTYEKQVEELDTSEVDAERERCSEYNRTIVTAHVQLQDPFKSEVENISEGDYIQRLNLNENGIMGYVEIPKISVNLPIYHGTSESTLQTGIGHLEGTSLPVGGDTTHTVLTGHTGLNRAKLFTDLVAMEEGDYIYLHILNEVLAYEVDQILVVEPSDTSALGISQGQDYCTLITCTPYGINSHRLLVRGHRVPYVPSESGENPASVNGDEQAPVQSQWMLQYRKNLIIAIGVIAAIVALSSLSDRIRDRRKRGNETS